MSAWRVVASACVIAAAAACGSVTMPTPTTSQERTFWFDRRHGSDVDDAFRRGR
jgi:hypothetical protein